MFGHFILNAFMGIAGNDQEVMLGGQFGSILNGRARIGGSPFVPALALETPDFATLNLHPQIDALLVTPGTGGIKVRRNDPAGYFLTIAINGQGDAGPQEMQKELLEQAGLQVSQPQAKMRIQILPFFSHQMLAI